MVGSERPLGHDEDALRTVRCHSGSRHSYIVTIDGVKQHPLTDHSPLQRAYILALRQSDAGISPKEA